MMKTIRYEHTGMAWEHPEGAILPSDYLAAPDPCSTRGKSRPIWECPLTKRTVIDRSEHKHAHKPFAMEGGYMTYVCPCGDVYRYNVPIVRSR